MHVSLNYKYNRRLIFQDVYELTLCVSRNDTYNRGLISLDMYGCRIGDVGARVIGAFFFFFLGDISRHVWLPYRRCGSPCHGCFFFFTISLDMYGCRIGDVGARVMGAFFSIF